MNITNLITRKLEKKKKKKGKARWSYNKMLIDLVGGPDGKIFGPRSWRSVRTPWPRAKYFPVQPSHSVNKYILCYLSSNSWRKALNRVIINMWALELMPSKVSRGPLKIQGTGGRFHVNPGGRNVEKDALTQVKLIANRWAWELVP